MSYKKDTLKEFNIITQEIKDGKISPVYVLTGDEPYFVDQISTLIENKVLTEEEKEFNQTILYGQDTTVKNIISLCSAYPMMAEHQVIIIKEAQKLRNIKDFEIYLDHIMDSTILVLCLTESKLDSRTKFYKKLSKSPKCVIFESNQLSKEALPRWLINYFSLKGKKISSQAAILMTENAGTGLRKLILETDKLLEADLGKTISSEDIENYIGISREFNTFELTSALSVRDADKVYKIVYFFGASPKQYPIQMTIGTLFYFFSRVEQISAEMAKGNSLELAAKNSGFYSTRGDYAKPYIDATKNYSLFKLINIISCISECDYRSKSNMRGNATDGELLTELVAKILA